MKQEITRVRREHPWKRRVANLEKIFHPEEGLRIEDVVADPVEPTPDRVAECHDLERGLSAALAELPPAWRDAFELHYVEDLSIDEVAQLVGQTQTEVRRRLDSALELAETARQSSSRTSRRLAPVAV